MKKNNVVFKQIRFVDSKNGSRAYYSSGKYLKYIMREEATLVDKTTGLYNFKSNCEYNFNEVNDIKDKMANLKDNQLFWDCVISLDKKYCESLMLYDPKDMIEHMQGPLKDLFEKNHMDINNFEIFGAFHQNTDNPHFHIGFYEITPKYIKNGKEQFNRIGVLGGKNCNYFKEFGLSVEKELENDNLFLQLKQIRKNVYEKTQEILKEKYTDSFSNLVNYWVENKIYQFQYNNLDEAHQEKISSTINMLIESDDELKELYHSYKDKLLDIREWYEEHNEIYKLDKSPDDWYKLENEGIDLRLANSILKTIKPEVVEANNINYQNNMIKKTSRIINDILKDDIEIRQNKMRIQDTKYNLKPIKNINNYNSFNFNYKNKKSRLMKVINDTLNQQLKESLKIYHQLQNEIQFEKERKI